jgi:hypothetical protein
MPLTASVVGSKTSSHKRLLFNVQDGDFMYIGETNHGVLHECPNDSTIYGPLQPQEPKHHPIRLPFEQQYCWKYQVHLTYPGGGQTSAAWTCAVVNAETIRVNATRGSFIIGAATTCDGGQRVR